MRENVREEERQRERERMNYIELGARDIFLATYTKRSRYEGEEESIVEQGQAQRDAGPGSGESISIDHTKKTIYKATTTTTR